MVKERTGVGGPTEISSRPDGFCPLARESAESPVVPGAARKRPESRRRGEKSRGGSVGISRPDPEYPCAGGAVNPPPKSSGRPAALEIRSGVSKLGRISVKRGHSASLITIHDEEDIGRV
ncbi:hypothetical protein KM043_003838 [Ampulex compressa]|nr:hypothetical protein KM043_003838 [Ampulex compressa]